MGPTDNQLAMLGQTLTKCHNTFTGRESTAIREIEVEIVLLSIMDQKIMDMQEGEESLEGITTGAIAGKAWKNSLITISSKEKR